MLEKYGLVFYKIGELFNGLSTLAFISSRDEAAPEPGFDGLPEAMALRLREQEDRHRNASQQRLKAVLDKILKEEFPSLRQWCERVSLTYSLKSLDYAERSIAQAPTFSTIERVIDELTRRIEDELDLVWFVHVSNDRLGSYRNSAGFGDRVSAKFPEAAFDVEHAGTCLALEEGTACVIHLMRVVESAVDAIALGTGVPESAVKAVTTWEHLMKEINNKIQENNRTSVPTWLASHSFYENALAYLHAAKNAWRNPSMHLDKKYTHEEAARIYEAAKNLMQHLAEHLDELGRFTA
jgi:hypothetical protein